jgi:hypothetical protein
MKRDYPLILSGSLIATTSDRSWPALRLVIDGTLPLRLRARPLFRQAPTGTMNIVAPGILYISATYMELIVGDINDQFRHLRLSNGWWLSRSLIDGRIQ